jgi:hypothetical protein
MTPAPALPGETICGAAFMMLSGIYPIWGMRALPGHPATGLTIGFFTIAIGQPPSKAHQRLSDKNNWIRTE